MPLYCAAIRPNFLNVQYLSFSNAGFCLEEIIENRKNLFGSSSTSILVSASCKEKISLERT